MGTVRFNFNERDLRAAASKVVNGRKMYKLSYTVEVDLFSDRGDLEIRCIMNGANKGKGTIQFDQSYDIQH
jgi:hypothetical protein